MIASSYESAAAILPAAGLVALFVLVPLGSSRVRGGQIASPDPLEAKVQAPS